MYFHNAGLEFRDPVGTFYNLDGVAVSTSWDMYIDMGIDIDLDIDSDISSTQGTSARKKVGFPKVPRFSGSIGNM